MTAALVVSVLHVLARLLPLPVIVWSYGERTELAPLVLWPMVLLYGASVAPAPGGDLDDAEEIALDPEELSVDLDPDEAQESPTERPPPALVDDAIDSETEAAFDALKLPGAGDSFDDEDAPETLLAKPTEGLPRMATPPKPSAAASPRPQAPPPVPDTKRYEKVEPIDDRHYKVVSGFGVGSVKVKFQLDVELSDVDPPKSLKMSARGTA